MYQSNISREQFAKILPILESARRFTKPRKINLCNVFCAVLYLLKSGCQWRMLPQDFPKWRSVHAYFQIWKRAEILNDILKKIGWRGSKKQWSKRGNELSDN